MCTPWQALQSEHRQLSTDKIDACPLLGGEPDDLVYTL